MADAIPLIQFLVRNISSHIFDQKVTLEGKAENNENLVIVKFHQNLKKYNMLEILRFVSCSGMRPSDVSVIIPPTSKFGLGQSVCQSVRPFVTTF